MIPTAAIQPVLLSFGLPVLHTPGLSNIIWVAALTAAAGLIVLAVRGLREGARNLATGREASTRLLRRLLIAAALVPLGISDIVDLAARMGWVDHAAVASLHVAAVTLILFLITLEVASAVQRSERQRLAALTGVRMSERRLQMQIDAMPIACVTFSPQFEISGWNPAAEKIFGWPEERIMGQSALLLLPDRNDADVRAAWRDLSGGLPRQNVNHNVTADGRTILCRWVSTPLIDEDGTLIGVIGMAEDITAEQQTRNELKAAERRHRELLDSLPHYIFSVDQQDRYTAVNSATCQFFERTEAEILGRTPLELGIPTNIAGEWLDQKKSCCAANRTIVDDRAVTRNGETREFRTILTPVRGEDGSIVGVTGIAIDATEQRAAEASTRELLSAVEQLDEVIFTTDREGIISYVNPAFERVYGYSLEEAVGQTPRILKSGEVPPEIVASLWSKPLSARTVRGEYRNRRKDGQFVDVVASASPLFDEHGGIRGFVAVQQNVTEQKRVEAEHEKLNERLSQFARMEALGTLAGGIAHDFNNILAIILSHVSLIERLESGEPRTTRAVATIKQAVERGASLSRQVLTIARRSEIECEQVDLAKIILEVGAMISETFP
ncbi:MAG TPA: PAS domain S-box protein, partial [Thermoanaerobaculia bacterium]|nr:PAS domain S-box protein [Thermoanaerobaculia bacterium]